MAAVGSVAIAAAPVLPLPLPHPRQLAELGTVLCMHRPRQGGELAGWMRAVRAESDAGMDSDGLYESLAFFDGQGQCCWRLFLLPDSDFLAWDTLASRLPAQRPGQAGQVAVAERLWRRLAARLGGNGWRLCALRLHVLQPLSGTAVLAASPVPVSPLGAATARRIARHAGAEGEVRVDDCCCARSALASLSMHPVPDHGRQVPLVRL